MKKNYRENHGQIQNIFRGLLKKFSIHENFQSFIDLRRKESELFKYWDNLLILIQLIKDLILADRTGNWDLYVESIKKCYPCFSSSIIKIIRDRPLSITKIYLNYLKNFLGC